MHSAQQRAVSVDLYAKAKVTIAKMNHKRIAKVALQNSAETTV
jgi:hypothetical protein